MHTIQFQYQILQFEDSLQRFTIINNQSTNIEQQPLGTTVVIVLIGPYYVGHNIALDIVPRELGEVDS